MSIQNRLKGAIVEKVRNDTREERQYYLPHKGDVREAAQSNKMCIVFDALDKANQGGPSFNNFLETGPRVQHLHGSVIVQNRLNPVPLCGDLIKLVFMQVRISEADRDTFWFH